MEKPLIGQMFGSYRIIGKLGEGGMGTVYEAEHVHVGRKAAVKILLPEWSDSEVVVERFFNEARSSALANHPGIVEIFDCGYSDGHAYLVMELLDGEPLGEILARERRLSVHRMTSLSRQLAGALAAAHDKGIVHRDLKPDNIFVISDRYSKTGERLKVLDFGIAKLASSKRENTSGILLGTPLYMSPEQCVASADVDGRSDIYALGCIMFEMLCGHPPFVNDEPGVLALMHVNDPPPRPRSQRRDIPINVDSLIVRTLAKNPDDRPQSMADLRAELDVVWGLLPPEESMPAPRADTPLVEVSRVNRMRSGEANQTRADTPAAKRRNPLPSASPAESEGERAARDATAASTATRRRGGSPGSDAGDGPSKRLLILVVVLVAVAIAAAAIAFGGCTTVVQPGAVG